MQCTIYYPSYLLPILSYSVPHCYSEARVEEVELYLQFQVSEGKPPEEGGLVDRPELIIHLK